jgi:hypothetical protein
MRKLIIGDVVQYVQENIGTFHRKRIGSLDSLKLSTVLRKKNPYLFKAKHVLTAEQIVKGLVDAHISSNEETVFGDWLEGLAVFINEKVHSGRKSGITGIDLEFDLKSIRYIVAIKSGPNWGNSRQVAKMVDDFKTAKKALRTSNSNMSVVAVNGCCYGRDNRPDKGNYFKYCGQAFWEFISDDPDLYTGIIEPLGHNAKEKNLEFLQSYSQMINRFTRQFANEFCKGDGSIDWDVLVQFNSAR